MGQTMTKASPDLSNLLPHPEKSSNYFLYNVVVGSKKICSKIPERAPDPMLSK